MTNPKRSNKPLRAVLWVSVSSEVQAGDDKESLPDQERRLREFADSQGWQVIDVLSVPGFSRNYYNYPEFAHAAAANKDPIRDPLKLLDHWQRRDFDVFAALDGTRFGRDQTIFGEVVRRTIDIDARLYTLRDGWIDKTNHRMYISMAGYAASTEIDKLKERRDMGMRRNAQKGLPTSSRPHRAFAVVRDELGKAERLEVVNEQFWNDVWTLLVVDRVNWSEMEATLYERFGYTRADGKPFMRHHIYQQLHSPTFWGHSARHWSRHPDDSKHKRVWAYDVTADPPEGVELYRNTHDPVWAGEKGESAIVEMLRRRTIKPGGAAYGAHRFAGLLLCDECEHSLSATQVKNGAGKPYGYMACRSRYAKYNLSGQSCNQRKHVSYRYLQAYIDDLLRQAWEAGGVEILFAARNNTANEAVERHAALEREQADLERELADVLNTKLKSSSGVRIQQQRIEQLDLRLEAIQRELNRINPIPKRDASLDRRLLAAFIEQAPDEFWSQPDADVNTQLHHLFGRWRLVVRDGKITHAIPRPANIRQKRR